MVRMMLQSERTGSRSFLLTNKGVADASAGVKNRVTSEHHKGQEREQDKHLRVSEQCHHDETGGR